MSSTGNLIVGLEGQGNFTQNQHTGVEVSKTLTLGAMAGSTGTYTLGGSFDSMKGYLHVADCIVGDAGTGTFTQSLGSHEVKNDLILGRQIGGNGTYALSGDTLEASNLIVGQGVTVTLNGNLAPAWNVGSSGLFQQSGGTNTVNGNIIMGQNAAATGTYSLSGGSLEFPTVGSRLVIGDAGYGTFNQTGGTINAVSTPGNLDIILGNGASGRGSFILEGTASILKAGNLTIGESGTGTFTQSGGTSMVNEIMIGNNSGSGGTYNLSGGSLTAATEEIGNLGTGIFNQSGGTHTPGILTMANDATYTLSDGLLSSVREIIGTPSGQINQPGPTPVFNQTGGTNNILDATFGYLILGQLSANGKYNLDGGSLSAKVEYIGGYFGTGQGIFSQSNGANSVIGGTGDEDGSLFLGYGGGSGTYNQSGGSNTIAKLLAVGYVGNGTYTLSGGNLAVNGVNTDLFNAPNGGVIIGLRSLGTFIQSGGSHTVADALFLGYEAGAKGEYQLSNGNLSAKSLHVGFSGSGVFTQTGGANSLSVALSLADQTNSTGTYSLDGGSLSAASVTIGEEGLGIFKQSAGIHKIDTELLLGSSAYASGTYELSGTGSLAAHSEVVGLSGTGTFTQTGGNNTTGFLSLGESMIGKGSTYNLSSGSLTADTEYIGKFGSGIFKQTGGSHVVNDTLTLGAVDNSSGTYELGGTGSLWVKNAIVGGSGTGLFEQTGGNHTVSNTLTLADMSGSTGTYNLKGGTLAAEYININSNGMLYQTGGTLVPGNTFTIGNGGTFKQSDGIVDGTSNTILIAEGGTCTLEGGTLRPGNGMTVQTGGTFTQTGGIVDGTSNTILITEGTSNLGGGTLRPGNSMIVHNGGTFTQTGGIVDGSSNTILINEGTCNLDGGTLKPGNAMIIRNGGIFKQTDGIVDGSSSTISIFEGTCNVAGGSYHAGTLNLYTGSTFDWKAGSLSYNNLNLAGGNFNNLSGNPINNQGTISGNGTITSDVTNSGTVSPGSSPGVLNIVGNYSQTGTGVYKLEIASTTSYDQIKVTGAASLDGTLATTLLGGYQPPRNLTLPGVITATGGVKGKFSNIDHLTPILTWQPRYNANSVDLMLAANFADAGLPLTANQHNVGVMFNGVKNITSGDLNTVLNTLSFLPTGVAVADAYQQISPDKASALPSLSLAGSRMQWQSVANRLSYQRWSQGGMPNLAGGRGGSFNLSYNSLAGMMLAYNGSDLTGLISEPRPKAESAGTWGLFTDFISTFGTQDSTINITGYNFSIFGFTIGADYRIRDDLVFGLGTGYYNTSASYKGSGGDANINSIPFYAYGAYTPGSFYAIGYLGYTLNLYSLDRNIAFGSINRVANGSPDGNQLNASLETGYDVKVAKFTVTPAFTLYYSTAWVDSFTESGAGALNLKVDGQSADSLQTGLGMRLSRPFQTGSMIMLPQIFAFYQHEFAYNSRGLDARLAQAGNAFALQTDSPSRNFALLGAGMALGLSKNLTLQANYNAEVGRGSYTPQMVSAGLRYEF